jgi:hypothetical protein
MSIFNPNDDYPSNGWSLSKLMGIFLIMTGAGVLVWTVFEIFQLFTSQSAFIFLETLAPAQITFSANGGMYEIPRELVVFGVPLWALGTTARIGLMLTSNGLQYMDRPAKK